MTYFDHTEKLEILKYLAEHKQAGTPKDLAKKLCVSERTVLRMVQQLRDHGYRIRPGIYYVEVLQGQQKTTTKLIKQSN